MRRFLLIFVLILLVAGDLTLAQEQNSTLKSAMPKVRPKIGVALEGGGALGLAHIGVLQWFEDHHIPVDYIAGTSMGGLVGGFYATGKSPAELKQIVKAQNWDVIIGGAAPYEDLSYRRKEDSRAFQNKIVLGLKNGLSLPAGLNAGQGITLLIDHETVAYSKLNSFDELPIPFRCVATDLVTGKEEVFGNGSLPRALRATMSIPGIFSPVRDGEKVYVDGGLVGNLPTEVVRQMGADVVIAVHLQKAPVKPEEIQSLFSVLGRSIDVVIHENELRGLSGADLIVNVNLRDFTSMDYPKAETIIDKGAAAAQAKQQILSPYAMNDAEWSEYLQARLARRQTDLPVPQFVKVEGTDPSTAKHMEEFLAPLAGKPIDNVKLGKLLTRLTGFGKFDWAGYQIANRDGQSGLLIAVHEKNYAPPYLQLGFEVDGSESGDVSFTQAARLTVQDKAGYRSEWRTDLLFGNTYGIASELYKPLTATSHWFIAPRGSASDANFKIYRMNDPVAEYRLGRATIGVDFGYGFNRFTEVRAGYEVGDLDAKLRLGTPKFASVSGRTGDFRFSLLTDHADDPIIPRRGYRFDASFRYVDTSPGATENFPVMDMRFGYFQPVSKPGSIFFTGEGGSTFGFAHTGIPQYFLGGPGRLSAYGTNELLGNQYYTFRAGYLHDLFTLPPFVGKKIYATASFEFGKMYGFPNQSAFPADVAAGVVAQTALGPIFLGGSLGDSGHQKWFFQLGHVF
ncbi:MAG: patatin-like phospholipase family protein [Acidobacteria bacterium]|nr:patatin-like phospholipase family protein [Acidobacteriota bacterium]MBS1866514.1 patatin-like phospholipase family protein [Acidobacteriota bacterium]